VTAPKAKPAPVLSEDELKAIVSGLLGRSVATSTMSLLSRLFAEHAQLKREVELLLSFKQSICWEHAAACCRDWCSACKDEVAARDALDAFDAAKPGAGNG
jgi:hypothetical protein